MYMNVAFADWVIFLEHSDMILILPVKGDGEPPVRFLWISPTEEAPHPFLLHQIHILLEFMVGRDCACQDLLYCWT